MTNLEELQEITRLFLVDRPTLMEANSHNDEHYLLDEVQELINETDPTLKAKELADVLFITLCIAQRMGIDLGDEFKAKAARNLVKYKSSDYQGGDYSLSREKTRLEWKNDDDFYKIV